MWGRFRPKATVQQLTQDEKTAQPSLSSSTSASFRSAGSNGSLTIVVGRLTLCASGSRRWSQEVGP